MVAAATALLASLAGLTMTGAGPVCGVATSAAPTTAS
ncbi:Uncharacterised protein [Mycobacterium tuberculosis]|nr:Uncharacterised protein [Mycobacterium tuberculosis]